MDFKSKKNQKHSYLNIPLGSLLTILPRSCTYTKPEPVPSQRFRAFLSRGTFVVHTF